MSSVTFLYRMKTSGKRMFSDVFKGYKNVTLDINGLTPLTENSTKGPLTSNYHLVFTTPGVTRNKAL